MTVPDLSTREGREEEDRFRAGARQQSQYEGVILEVLGEKMTVLLDALDAAEAGAMKWREHAAGLAQTAAKRDQDRAAAIARADRAEAALQRVRDVLDAWDRSEHHDLLEVGVRRALDDGSLTTPCGRGPCALGDGHAGDCRM